MISGQVTIGPQAERSVAMFYKLLALLIAGVSIYAFQDVEGEQAFLMATIPAAAIATALILGSV
jgi:hypothetical protein